MDAANSSESVVEILLDYTESYPGTIVSHFCDSLKSDEFFVQIMDSNWKLFIPLSWPLQSAVLSPPIMKGLVISTGFTVALLVTSIHYQFFDSEVGESTFIRNICESVPDHTTFRLRRR
jgi:hypothetical protein